MSNIYIQEPPTLGKVLLQTTVGDVDIELWARETPKACRNFVQLCLEGYYDNTIFHRIVKGFIVQGGDPTGTGEGGESIYGAPFKDEFHSRLRFVRRGLVAMANSEKDDNGSQFFFTMAPANELQNKHTIFGKVAGDTLFNMLKLEDCLVDKNERPLYPPKLTGTVVLKNPFDDIVPRVDKNDKKDIENEVKSKSKATKNFNLLSFGDEAEEDEEEVNKISKEYRDKSKSSHDLIEDPQLSSKTGTEGEKPEAANEGDEEVEEEIPLEIKLDQVRNKLKKGKTLQSKRSSSFMEATYDEDKKDAIRKEIKQLKKEIVQSRKKNEKKVEAVEEKEEEKVVKGEVPEAVAEFRDEIDKFGVTRKRKKGTDREAETLQLLAKFQKKLLAVRGTDDSENEEEKIEKESVDEESQWLGHTLQFESKDIKVKDANVKDEDTYEIYDPRNPINQRRRGDAGKRTTKKK